MTSTFSHDMASCRDVQAFPASFAQQRLWFLDQLEPDSATYNIPVAVRLRGLLDVRALERSLNAIVQRHEALRTTFTMRNGQPMRVIAPTLTVSLPAVDLRDFPQTEREAEALWLATEEAQRPFNLTQGPLMRAALLWLKEDEHILLLTMHQIVFDDWSTIVFIRELAVLYESFSLGKPSSLPDLPIQYADYVCWQRERLQDDVLAAIHLYWKLQLSGAPAILQLPTDRPRSAARTFESAQQSLVLPKTLTETLQALSRQEGATLFMTLLAAFQILLQRYTGQEDLVVGSSVTDRTRAEVECLVGCFVNTLALRTNLSGNPGFRELLARVREVILGAYAHVDLPFEQLAEELQPDGNLNRPPTFDVMINFVNTPQTALELPGLTISSLQIVKPASKSSMTLYVETEGSELSLRLVYQRALFLPERIDCMLNQLQYLLEQIAAEPEKPIQLYSLVAPESVHLLPDPLAVLPEPPYELITQTFAFWVKRAREQPAVCQGLETWTYGELAESSYVLAQFLLAQRLEPGDVVAILGLQSFGLVASMMAVFLSGGVLLPIDRNLPTQRQQLMLREAGAKHLLYIGDWRPEDKWVQELPALDVLQVDPGKGWVVKQGIAPRVEAAPLPELGPNDAAYIFFTSGTTGIPKGVLGCHKGLSHFLNWQRKTFAVGPHDRCAQLTSLSFDVVLRDVFLPLTSGATLCLPERPEGLGPEQILLWLERERISLLHTVPTLAQFWLAKIPPEVSLRSLRWVFFAGEPLTDALVRRWREAFPEAGGIANLYGPTETSLAKCFSIVESNIAPGVQPVGRALPETQALVLTQSDELCGIGELGEIVLRTPFCSLGYINAPQENRKRFSKNPFRDDEGDLLYHTGDRGRYGLDGSLEILGRLDHQVKIRGVRVEPDEIMTILQQHPSVRTCAVVAQNNEQGQYFLVAYVVIEKQERVTSFELRSFLSRYLPPPMVPSAFVLLDALPLSPNGKVNRRALPTLDQVKLPLEETFVAPRTAIEEILVGIWAEILGFEHVGIHDDFFALGGQSLLAMQVTSRLRSILQVEVPLRSFFEAPTVAQLAEAITQLKASGAIVHKSALHARSRGEANRVPMSSALPVQEGALVREISKEKDETTSTSIVSHQSLDQDLYMLPASFAQQRLWFLDQLVTQSAAYNIRTCFRISTSLDVATLEQSFNVLVQRHEVLRTTFVAVDGYPMQVIVPALILPLPVIDLSVLPNAEREAEALRLANEEVQRPFNLAQGPLMRILLLQLGAEEYLLLLTMHHIISDEWSINVLFQELTALYAACASGTPSPLPDLPVQYADFALWQQEQLRGEAHADQLAYWKQQLAGAPAILDLPADRPHPAVPTFRGSVHLVTLPPDLTEELKALSRRESVSLHMMLVAAFQTLLHRYTGQDDIVLGTITAGRMQVELEALIGFFVNTLVLRTDLSNNPTFRELLERVREVTLEAHAHQEVPFDSLVRELQPNRALGQNPLFQVMLALDPPLPALPAGWEPSRMVVETSTAKFDLFLELIDRPEGLICRFEYSTDLFDATTIARMAGHWQTLLEGIVANPIRHLAELPLLTEKERQQLLVEWNATQAAYPQDTCLHQLFEAQVERTPDAVAVSFEGEQLTYRELNSKANQLAHYLQKLDVGPEVLVGLCVERSLEMVVGLLGILKAGGAYVPLDPTFPPERLAFMLQDAQVPVLVTQQHLLAQLTAHGTKVVCLDADAAVLAQQSEANTLCAATSANLAYVIYTSGSTGRPKGVQVLHRAVVNFMLSMRQQPGLTAQDTLLAITTLSFDIAALELFLPLLVGARVIVASRETAADGAALAETLTRAGVTVMQATPITWRLLLAAGWQGKLDLKILCGGEALPLDLAQQLLSRAASLWNMYGPTETTIWSTLCKIEAEEGVVTIGRPIANTQMYLLDLQLQPVPVGVPGELHIGGDGLARGYLKRPELTAERFIPHPFSNEPGARLYKTGDLARYLPDGTIEHLGRLDYQVKLRGFRIELGEIEAVLAQHPAVRQAVVVAREDVPGDKRLVAYLVTTQEPPPAISELRSFLKEQLPEYMLPSAFVFLEALPLTPNGKVDRRALPVPGPTKSTTEDTFVAPTLLVHYQLLQIWEELFNIRPIGMRDDFFELGGHSLLATRLVNRIEQVFRKKISLATLFAGPTIEQLADALQKQEEEKGSGSWSPLVAVQTGGSKRPFFFLHGDYLYGAYYCFPLARKLGLDQPFYALEPYKFDILGIPPTLEVMAAAHLESLRSVQPEGPYLLGGFCNGGLIAYEMARQLHAQGETVDLLILIEPTPVGRSRLTRHTINRLGKLMRLDQDKQLFWFLWLQHKYRFGFLYLRHVYRYLRHAYRYLRYSRYRKSKDSERLSYFGFKTFTEPILGRDEQTAPEPLPRLNELFPKALFPAVDAFRQDWESHFFWIMSEYEPGFYPGKSTFFFTKDGQKSGLDVYWRKIAEAKDKEVEVHYLAGRHDTCKTIHLNDLTDHLRMCLNGVQAAESGLSNAFLR